LSENNKGALIDFDAVKAYHHERDARRRAPRESERRAPGYPQIHRVHLFGSLVQPGRFGAHSDIDVAVVCDTPEAESAFWAALERDLRRDIDVRPLTGPLVETVEQTGRLVYER
jgi:predicted nucleotidyltransferase